MAASQKDAAPELAELYVNIEDQRWAEAGLAELAARAFGAVLTWYEGSHSMSEISLLGCDDARICDLNAEFRAKPKPTNVLSWPMYEYARGAGKMPSRPNWDPRGMPLELGDIAIAFDVCTSEAAAQNKTFSAHVSHLLVHACLHLLGFDHIDEKDAGLMEEIEVEILGKLGIADPY